ncbi:uncharacterized protein LOC112467105 [Temnothorax curvispinosus]|uniref:Uncharacterized protein LOC112467105 n=1 Tax=Temnothorax curvispinosus TaxID=300111 RepID=A0A6J1R9I8_9HYME|nr:uncharacterized protein LOC112467105 [Temnothorax curvispinosus]
MKALIGCETRGMAEARFLTEIQDVVHRLNLAELRNHMKMHIDLKQQEQKVRYDKTRRDAKLYKKGDLVLVRITSDLATGSSRKLYPKFKGPFRIHKILINDRYEIEDLRENRKRGRTVAAADNLKPWITIQGELAITADINEFSCSSP